MISRMPAAAGLAIGSACLLIAAACSSSAKRAPTPSATDTFAATLAREQRLDPFLVQCLARQRIPVWDTAVGKMDVAGEGTREGWFVNGRVIANDAFWRWFRDHDGTYAYSRALRPYKTLDDWVAGAVENGAWPAKVCGPMPAA